MTNMKHVLKYIGCALLMFITSTSYTQTEGKDKALETALSGFSFRSIGPAFMSGRIADIAIDPNNENVWYVAVGSGGTWKTINAGTTWTPLTDKESFYSTGCITIDPSNSSVIWLGTGENVGGRHVGVGHGIYRSSDGGSSWQDMGLKKSEHISKIIVHPNDPNTIWVAVQGPLWSSGGERGLYKSTDGGKTWSNKLDINEWTGVTDLVIDPTNPNVLYLASWQRHRNVAALMGGGPGTSIYKSTDGGDNWVKIDQGLPNSNKGKIGLAISPMNPEVLYAAVELDRRNGAVYRSSNSGASWTKMSDTVSGATGPHYYQELVASPHHFDRIYLMNVRALVSNDGGKTFNRMSEANKHSDNHSLTFKKNDPNYLLFGTDGGIYESFDDTKSWKFVNNLPLTQYYKLAVDDAEPFYNIYGGTQDNNTQGGPSRTLRDNGITNSDWYVLLGGDGHQPATEPGNPNIVYAQWQQGNLYRVDKTTMEAVYIKPQSGIDEPFERYNWDAPILVSQHDPKRLYFGTQRVWRSDNRGDSWTAISGDLTKNEERLALPIMGRQQSFDNPWDVYAMSTYNTITSLSESKSNPGVLYAGTDDGIIQYTKDGGTNWTKMTVDKLPGAPSTAFVNDIKVDLHDNNTAYVALDNHKYGDYDPYLYKTTNGGKDWESIGSGIPEGTLVWRIVQDHVNPNLLFLATEYGVYISLNQGENWHKFSTGLPTIAVRDLAIQKRENDLVLATFGRSFYVLDDYSALRGLTEESVSKDALLFPVRTALQYNQVNGGTSSQGGSYYSAKNPEYGAMFTFYMKEGHESLKSARKKAEGKLKTEDIPFPGWAALDAEKNEPKGDVILVISNSSGELVDRISSPLKKGLHRVNWDLKKPYVNAAYANSRGNSLYARRLDVSPGTYTVRLQKRVGGSITDMAEPQSFEVKRIRENVLDNPIAGEREAYIDDLMALNFEIDQASHAFEKSSKRLQTLIKALPYLREDQVALTSAVYALRDQMNKIDTQLEGSSSKAEVGEKDKVTLGYRMYFAANGLMGNSYGPTMLHMESFEMAKTMFSRMEPTMESFVSDVEAISVKMEAAGAPRVLD
jgi:photosystem II stability/assembly factor-like uncharacterized protein